MSGFDSINSIAWAILAASLISSFVESSAPYLILLSIVPENKTAFCGTYPISSLSLRWLIFLISTPFTKISPSVTSKKRGIKFIKVDLPLPVLPIKAVVWPGFATKFMLLITLSSASGYLNETFLNSTSPYLSSSNSLVSFESFIATSVDNISPIRLAETDALGNITDNIDNIKNDIIICIEYWINAIISPTCITPASILWEPTQTISIVIIFIINIIVGIITDIIRFTNVFVFLKSMLISSNLFSSTFWLLKALITNIPTSDSRVTKFSLSTSFCTFLNLGIAKLNKTIITKSIATTATPIIHAIDVSVFKTFSTPPIPSIGAYNIILTNITVKFCICWISFVLRVISDAVENLSNSTFEKLTTFLNTSLRRLRPIPAPTLEPINPTTIVANKLISAIPSIAAPDLNI